MWLWEDWKFTINQSINQFNQSIRVVKRLKNHIFFNKPYDDKHYLKYTTCTMSDVMSGNKCGLINKVPIDASCLLRGSTKVCLPYRDCSWAINSSQGTGCKWNIGLRLSLFPKLDRKCTLYQNSTVLKKKGCWISSIFFFSNLHTHYIYTTQIFKSIVCWNSTKKWKQINYMTVAAN